METPLNCFNRNKFNKERDQNKVRVTRWNSMKLLFHSRMSKEKIAYYAGR